MIDRIANAPAIVRGALWMLLTGFGFAIVPVAVRAMTDTLPVFEIVFLRNLAALLPAIPLVMGAGFGVLRTRRLGAHLVRAGFNYFAMLTYFWGIQVVLVADAVSIQFLIPVLTALGAAWLLREKVGLRRWVVCVVALAGAMVIVRPGFQAVGPHVIAVLVSTFFYAGAWIMVKVLTNTERASVIVFYLNLLLLVFSTIPAMFVWVTPGWEHLPAILALGLGGWIAHFAQARAFAVADVSAMAPLDFLRLPFVAVFGFVLFSQVPDVWTWLGAAIIVAAATYLTRAESRRPRAAAAATPAPGSAAPGSAASPAAPPAGAPRP